MNREIVKFIECLIPITLCNLKCHYCYVIQRHNRNMKHAHFNYNVPYMLACLSKKRFGGSVYFSICGAGETMLCPQLPELVKGLLSMGHIVNITTNGTCTKQLTKLLDSLAPEESEALHFSFSFHYLELKRLHLFDTFFNNVRKVRDAGCSYFVQFNLNDEYIPYLDDIKNMVLRHTGALPQVAATRKEINIKSDIELYSNLDKDEYYGYGKSFDSPLFEYTMKNFNVSRKEYCYAGQVSYVLNLATGILQACYASIQRINIFTHPNAPINFDPIGHHCPSKFCMNSSHFMALGVIPSRSELSYASLRNRHTADGMNWYNSFHQEVLSKKLPVKKINIMQRVIAEIRYIIKKNLLISYNYIPKQIKQIYRKQKNAV